MMMRNCFVREEDDHLVIGSGILPEWRETGQEISFGPTPTAWGPVAVRIEGRGDRGRAADGGLRRHG